LLGAQSTLASLGIPWRYRKNKQKEEGRRRSDDRRSRRRRVIGEVIGLRNGWWFQIPEKAIKPWQWKSLN
jgi:hypothetical protein